MQVEKSRAVSSKKTSKKRIPSLTQLAKKDTELRDFIKLIYQHDLREKAAQALERVINPVKMT